jgi:Short repeat of unknown function (DUF308)
LLPGVVALVWPGITALALALLVAVRAFVFGSFELFLDFNGGQTAGERPLLGLTGLISVALSVVFAIRPDVTVVTIAEVYGLFSIVAGISSLVVGANLRSATPVRVRQHVPSQLGCKPWVSSRRSRDASTSYSAAARSAQDAPSTLLPGSSCL